MRWLKSFTEYLASPDGSLALDGSLVPGVILLVFFVTHV